MTDGNAPQQRLIDGVVDYLGALKDDEFEALVAQARPPVDSEAPARQAGSAGAKEAERRFGTKAR